VNDLSKELARLNENGDGNLIVGGLKEVKRSFTTACLANKITNLRKHDFRHAFVSRSIFARLLRLDLERGIPERIRTAAGSFLSYGHEITIPELSVSVGQILRPHMEAPCFL